MTKKTDIGSSHVAEGTIHAWLDGALSAHESAAVQSHVTTCDTCSAAVAEARGFIAGSTRILSALDDVPGEVIPRVDRAVNMGQRRSRSATIARLYAPIAAVAALAIVATLLVRRQPHSMRQVIPTAIQPLSRSTVVAAGASAAKPAIPPSQSQRGRQVELRAPDAAVRSTLAGKVAETPRPAAVAMNSGAAEATGATRADVAGAKSQVAAAPQTAGAPPAVSSSAARATQAHDSLAITGRVTAAATGLPLGSATINVVGTGSNAVTDSTGAFTINNVPAGTHMLQVRRIGFEASSAQVTVPTNRYATVAFALPQTPLALSNMVVTGQAVAPAAQEFTNAPPTLPGARMISSGVASAPNELVRRSVYELASGTRVTLLERRVRTGPPRVARLGATVADAQKSIQDSRSVSWTASDGTLLTLSGALSAAELDALENQLVVH